MYGHLMPLLAFHARRGTNESISHWSYRISCAFTFLCWVRERGWWGCCRRHTARRRRGTVGLVNHADWWGGISLCRRSARWNAAAWGTSRPTRGAHGALGITRPTKGGFSVLGITRPTMWVLVGRHIPMPPLGAMECGGFGTSHPTKVADGVGGIRRPPF